MRASAAQFAPIYIRPFASPCNAVQFFFFFFALLRVIPRVRTFATNIGGNRRFAFHFNWFFSRFAFLVSFGVWPHATRWLHCIFRSINHHLIELFNFFRIPSRTHIHTDGPFRRYVSHTCIVRMRWDEMSRTNWMHGVSTRLSDRKCPNRSKRKWI